MEAKDWIGPAATVAGFFIVNFAAEGYKRFKAGAVLAAGVVGELRGYERAWKLNVTLITLIQFQHSLPDSKGVEYKFPQEFETPKDRVFDSNVENLGLLGSTLATKVSLIYGLILGFRVAMKILFARYHEMSVIERRDHARAILIWLNDIEVAYAELMPLLERRSTAWWFADDLLNLVTDYVGFTYPR